MVRPFHVADTPEGFHDQFVIDDRVSFHMDEIHAHPVQRIQILTADLRWQCRFEAKQQRPQTEFLFYEPSLIERILAA